MSVRRPQMRQRLWIGEGAIHTVQFTTVADHRGGEMTLGMRYVLHGVAAEPAPIAAPPAPVPAPAPAPPAAAELDAVAAKHSQRNA